MPGCCSAWPRLQRQSAVGPAAAGALIALAAIADTFDGRFARLFAADAGQVGLGAELDSLCDACTFGLAPVVCTAALAGAAPAIAWCWGGWLPVSGCGRDPSGLLQRQP